MIIKKITPFIIIGILIALFISVCAPTLHAQVEPPAARQDTHAPMSLMEVAPANPLLVLQIKDVADALALIGDTRAWQQIIEAPLWEVVWASLEMESGVKESQRLIRPSLSILSHLLGKEALFLIPKFKGILELSPTLLIQIDRTGDLGEMLAAAIEVGLANVPNTGAREYNGYSYLVTEKVGPGLRLAVGLVDDLLIVSVGEGTLRKVIDLHQGKSTESLAHDAEFSQMMARFQTNPADRVTDFQSLFYVDVATIHEFAKLMYPMAQGKVPAMARPLADQAVGWLDLVQSVMAASHLTTEGVVSQSYMRLNPDATANNFLAMLQGPPTVHDSIKFVPADAAGYVASNLIDLPRLWKMAMDVLHSMPPEMSEQFLSGLEAIQTQFNINIEKDLFSWMGNELALINHGDTVWMPEAAAYPHLLVLIETTNSAQAAESLGRLAQLGTMLLAAGGKMQMDWQTMDYSGTEIHTAEISGVLMEPGYAVTGKYALITTDSALLKSALDCAAGRAENLAALPQFQELRPIVPEKVNTINYANPIRSLTGTLESLTDRMRTRGEGQGPSTEEENAALIRAILPQATDLLKAISQVILGQIGYTVTDGNGLRSYSFLKVRDLDTNVTLADPPEAKIARSLFIARGYMENEMPDRAQPYLDRVLEIDVDNPDALMMKVTLLESEGDEKRANWYRRRLGFANENAWYIIGPFANPNSEGFDTAYPPEMGVNLEATYETESGGVTWQKRQDDNPNDGFVNFADMFEEPEWKVAYAWTTITVPEAGEVELRIGSDDDIKVWVNGVEVLINQIGRPAAPDQDRAHVSLRQGENQILVKVCNREGDWGFYLRFTDDNRRPIKGLTYGN